MAAEIHHAIGINRVNPASAGSTCKKRKNARATPKINYRVVGPHGFRNRSRVSIHADPVGKHCGKLIERIFSVTHDRWLSGEALRFAARFAEWLSNNPHIAPIFAGAGGEMSFQTRTREASRASAANSSARCSLPSR